MLKAFLNGLCDVIYPRNCLVCKTRIATDQKTQVLCRHCRDAVEPNRPPFCLKCSRPLRAADIEHQPSYCPECRSVEHHFDRAWAATLYNDPMKRLLHLFKYKNKTSLAGTFADYVLFFIRTYNIDMRLFDVLIPIPLHTARLRERGYNQSQLLADRLSKEFSIRHCAHGLKRIHHTKNQALLGKKERWTNIRGAFKIKDPSCVLKKSILIVDDLLTTGATASEAAKILKEASAREVYVLSLAIAFQESKLCP